MSDDQPDWKKLELLVAAIQKQLAPDANVSHNAKLMGVRSETMRQIDVLVEQNLGQYRMRIVIDCKDYAHPVDVKGIEEFDGLVKDVAAHRGAIVCPSGFTEAARKSAKRLQIDLYRPVDTDPHKWTTKLSVPALCDLRKAKVGFGMSFSDPWPLSIRRDIWNIPVFSESNAMLGTLLDVVVKKWNAGEYPSGVGEHERVPVGADGQLLIDNGYGMRVSPEFYVHLIVERQLYYGKLPIRKLRGLRDEQTGHVVTNAFTTESLNPGTVMSEWRKVAESEELPGPVGLKVVGLLAMAGGLAPTA